MKEKRIREGTLDALTVVSAFLVYAERENGKDMMFGSWTVEEAIEALSHLIGCTPDDLRQMP